MQNDFILRRILILSFLAAAFQLPATASQFLTARSFPVQLKPVAVAVGDFNNDGKPDLAVANRGGNGPQTGRTVSVLLGKGDGSFAPAVNYIVGDIPDAVVTGDFNHDGNLDLAVSTRVNGISILLGNGDGTFQPAVNSNNNTFISFLLLGDFNSDGNPDLVLGSLTNSGSNVMLLMAGNGDGTFKTPVQIASFGSVGVVAGVDADFNGDHKLDFAVTLFPGPGPGNVAVILGNGNGTFQAPVTYSLGVGAQSLTAADFNGDGKLDLAVAVFASAPSKFCCGVSILLGNGDGTFQAARTFRSVTDGFPGTIAAGDFNGDGKTDLVVANTHNDDVTVLLGNGDGTFKPPQNWAAGQVVVDVVVGDFNLDGKLDLAAVDFLGNSVSILLGRGDGGFRAARDFFSGASGVGFVFVNTFGAVGDFNEDGKPDLAVTNQNGVISVLLALGGGRFGSPVQYQTGVNLPEQQVAVADLNGDHHLDLVVVNACTGASACPSVVSVLLGKGDGTFQPAVTYNVGHASGSVAIADFNGDGKLDLVTNGGQSGVGDVRLLLGNGDGTFQPATTINVGNTNPTWITAGDFNGDGKLDLAVANSQGPPGTAFVVLGNGDGTFQAPSPASTVGNAPGFLATADLNNDGKLDVVVVNFFSHNVSVLLGKGDGTFLPAVNYKTGQAAATAVIADFNRDGKLDIAVANLGGTPGDGTGSVPLLFGNGDGTFHPMPAVIAGSNPSFLATSDFNGDGKPDLAVFNNGANNVTILINTSP